LKRGECFASIIGRCLQPPKKPLKQELVSRVVRTGRETIVKVNQGGDSQNDEEQLRFYPLAPPTENATKTRIEEKSVSNQFS
jgi:hypothetical protein